MKQLFLLIALSPFLLPAQKGNSKVLPAEIQISTATLPLPEKEREGAMVYGFNAEGRLIVLRKGSNNMVCIADDPNREGISVSCYSKRLEPFMARGRELNAEGKSQDERNAIRGEEIASGKLQMPKEPSMLYVFFGKEEDYDPATGALANGKFRYVIYTPFATTESTGLPDKPHAPGMPWLMDPGTHRAHIMVGPFN
ncbi:hypothetical protein SAMN06265375_1011257 [Muriicola jejuensis]|uniref:Uncharacterized protein n=1 Tax=Muriicola jejuensis TaxID=504488 RepID=A0A6P0U7K7_9FLAO|nr:hypothetical protein [Muriicola jejuensis]NER09251.1 hypothetical protein [Muriicola jejuensis]SMP09977.1 hypothetical protein SAMN06265375_1011257 [Muriicola jejuensis]